jgi:Type IV secretion system pilin
MKKTLLACSLIIGSVFFASAQIDLGGVKVNVGQVCGKVDGKPACVNPTTGQWEVSTGNGTGIGGNVKAGQVSASGVFEGVRIGGTFGGGAATNGGFGSYGGSGLFGLIGLAQNLLTQAAPLLVGVALLAFFWFLVMFIWKGSESSDEQAKGKKGMLYSILALFVMASIWGIIGFMGTVLGINQGGTMSGFNIPGKQ